MTCKKLSSCFWPIIFFLTIKSFHISLTEKKDLNLSFQLIQKKLRDVLASIIKKISKDKKIDFVVLKENIFLMNNFDLDLTNEALKEFDKKTSNLKIQLVEKKGK